MTDSIERNDTVKTGEAQDAPPPDSYPEAPTPAPSRPSRKWKPGEPSWGSAQYPSSDPRIKSPFLAAFLSLVPGLGQVYVGYYTRGFINPIVIGTVLSLLIFTAADEHPPFYFPICILFLIFYWLYNIIDAWRRAMLYNLALEGVENIALPDDMSAPDIGGSIFGGSVLLIGGFVVLMHTRFGMPIEVIEQWWPLAPIAFGGFLIYRGYMDKKQ